MEILWNLPGKVYLVGAGPGSTKLLTVRAVEVLQRADVVLHDDLVSSDVLEMVPPRTAVYNMGKRCGIKKVTQKEINQRMISAARSGQRVVRLKGGDPLIFGRTQEEIRALREAAIDFEIVPGITAATAAAAAAEIPLTDRKMGARLIFASNHRGAEGAGRSWREAALRDGTLVIYMPGQDLAALQKELCEGGVSDDTPCLMVSEATRPQQRVVRTRLRDLASAVALPAPSVLIVGAVASGASAADSLLPQEAEEVLDLFRAEEAGVDLEEPDDIRV